ncbi:hypothetical protein MY4824_009438 [Beauveria thailandica]
MLESAIVSPMNHKHYGQMDLFQLAGTLAEKVILDHPYQDGNKRAALFAADMFLKINGYQLQKYPMDANEAALNKGLADAHVLVATSQWTSEELGKYYSSIAKRVTETSTEIEEYIKNSVEY